MALGKVLAGVAVVENDEKYNATLWLSAQKGGEVRLGIL